MEGFLVVPVWFLLYMDMFEALLVKYFPDVKQKVTLTLTINDLLSDDIKPAFMEDLKVVAANYFTTTAKEVAEFGVNIDPNALRYQWTTDEVKEQVVKMIEETYPVAENQGNVICYGPSNMTYWYSLEKDMEPYTAQNHGMGGCIDGDLMHYAPRLLYPYNPSVVIFQTGSNDIANGIPLATILENKKKMYGMFLKAMPNTKFVVCSGLPLPGRPEYWDATVETNELLRGMCEETDRMYFMDATDGMLTDKGPDKYKTSDGRYFNPEIYRIDKIHLNKKGHDIWTEYMKNILKEIL